MLPLLALVWVPLVATWLFVGTITWAKEPPPQNGPGIFIWFYDGGFIITIGKQPAVMVRTGSGSSSG